MTPLNMFIEAKFSPLCLRFQIHIFWLENNLKNFGSYHGFFKWLKIEGPACYNLIESGVLKICEKKVGNYSLEQCFNVFIKRSVISSMISLSDACSVPKGIPSVFNTYCIVLKEMQDKLLCNSRKHEINKSRKRPP